MMKKKLFNMSNILKSMLLVIALFSFYASDAQSRNRMSVLVAETKLHESFPSASLFSVTQDEKLASFTKEGTALTLDAVKLQQLMQQKNNSLTLSIPTASGKIYELEIVKVDITSDNFAVGTKGLHPLENINYQKGLYYRGIVKNDFNSIAAVSLFNDEAMIVFSTAEGNFVLGKVRDNSGRYALYNDKNVLSLPPMECATDYNLPSSPLIELEKGGGNPSTSTINCKVVHCYYECDFAMYQAFSSNVTSTSNYMTSIFNVKATLYANDGMTIEISQIYVWTTTDPEAPFTSTSTVNAQFITSVGSAFNGDMANFLTTRNLGGGIAQGFSGLCNKSQAHCTAMIYTTFSSYPTYSWTVEVITHEMGHLLGSRHTHACVWNGTNTAIDGCSGATEGGCPLPGNPAGGGTIMSYCHLVSGIGINFTLGFGPQPAALLQGNFAAATCLTGSSATTPTGLNTTAIGSTSATLNWNASAGAIQYSVEYKLSSASTYTVLGNFTTNLANLTGLTANSSYDWRVNADCSPMSSPITFNTSILTGCGVPTGLVANNIGSTNAKLNWNAYAGASKYRTHYRVFGTTTWTLGPITTTPYYNITGLTANTKYDWSVRALCSGTWTAFATKKTFKTTTLNPPVGYCASNGADASLEYINVVQIGSINKTSGNNSGYANFMSLSTSAAAGSSVALSISLTKSNASDVEYVTVFVDFNRDADFDDAGEAAYSANGTLSTFTGSFTIPATASIGQTRMRVSMQYGSAPPTCGTYSYGEVEDYKLNMIAPPLRTIAEIEQEATSAVSIAPNPANDEIKVTIDDEIDNYTLQIYSVTGQLLKTVQLNGNIATVNVIDLAKGIYQLRVIGSSQNIMNSRFVKN
ncbi:MAG: GEVED domain-containing protein [Bacteroidia bacterium]